ncbi:MAG: PGF-CTERM sorting domain-containing protein, partial [Methanosarcinales archaeon]|nr:PGF-CTERM sorting domain-containing protein [Methanosarcinales archaeon]
AKAASEGTSSTPGFGVILAAAGILGALFLAIRRK